MNWFTAIRRIIPAQTLIPSITCCISIVPLLGLSACVSAEEPSTPAAPVNVTLREELRVVVEAARNRVFPALVNIQVVTVGYVSGREVRYRAVGSGTIIDGQGHVLTNQHVTSDGSRFRCTLYDRTEISATLVGEDPLTDLAVLRLNLSELGDRASQLPIATLGDSSQLEVGDLVMAMGSPLALARSVTLGIISNTERVFADGLLDSDGEDMRLSAGQRTGMFTRWLQHDALIQPGNSGGPLVNLQGEIIGINELGGNSMGFAIPSNMAREIATALIAHGEVARSWIGVSLRTTAKTGFTRGALVNSVITGSPADRAGLAPGDLLLEIDGKAVVGRFAEEIPLILKQVADAPVGSKLTLRFERDGQEQTATLETQKLEKDLGDERELRTWGLTMLELTPFTIRERRLGATEGALISGIRVAGSAATCKPPLAVGDVVKSVDGQPVKNLAELLAIYEKLSSQKPAPKEILLEFDRQGENCITILSPQASDKEEDPPRSLAKAWLGVMTQPVLKDLAQKLGVKETGFRVTRIYPKTKAAASQLQVGDVITRINGERIDPRRAEDTGMLQRAVQNLDIEGTAELTVVRGSESQTIAVELEPSRIGPDEAKRERNRDFDLGVREVTFFDRVENRWDEEVDGVLVAHCEAAGWCGLGGIYPGDLIQRIGTTPIVSLKDFRNAMAEVTQNKPARVVFVVLRGGQTRFQFVEPEWTSEPAQNVTAN